MTSKSGLRIAPGQVVLKTAGNGRRKHLHPIFAVKLSWSTVMALTPLPGICRVYRGLTPPVSFLQLPKDVLICHVASRQENP